MSSWPALPFAEWQNTCETVHMWTQIVGKTRMALEPRLNHWWHVALYVSPRGLRTSPMPVPGGRLELEFDFLDHELIACTSDGRSERLALQPRSVRDFYADYRALLGRLNIEVPIWPVPVEVATAIPFAEDTQHAAYDKDYVGRFWRIVDDVDRIMQKFRSRFTGKASPVHFFWGGFDLAATRFSGRPAPPHPGGVPNVADWVMREAYSHEVSSCGFWPGASYAPEAAFYSYAYPEPPGFADAAMTVPGARYDQTLREFLLPYAALRTQPDPEAALLAFLQDTYDAAAIHAKWDRAALEYHEAQTHAGT